MSLPIPDTDFLCVIEQDAQGATATTGFGLAPDGDLGIVAGADRLDQDIRLELLTQQGANAFLPAQGSTVLALVGRTQSDPQAAYGAMVNAVEQQLIARHADDLDAGLRSKDAALDHLASVAIATHLAGTVLITYTFVSVAGVESAPQTVGVSSGGSA